MQEFRDGSTQAKETGPGREPGTGPAGSGASTIQNLIDLMVAPYASIMRAAAGAAGEGCEHGNPAGPIGGGPSEPRVGGEIGTCLAQAYLSIATRGVHYWWRIMQVHARHQSDILGSLTTNVAGQRLGPSEQERRILIDRLRAYLREIGDVSVQEARVVQAELDGLAASLAESSLGPAATMEKWRRWKAIP